MLEKNANLISKKNEKIVSFDVGSFLLPLSRLSLCPSFLLLRSVLKWERLACCL